MSSLYATLLVIGLIVCIGGPVLYWIFFRMDEPPQGPVELDAPAQSLSNTDIARIESSLQVQLPPALATFLTEPRSPDGPDDTSLLDSADAIIEATLEYRRGFSGLPPWPTSWVYLGDEADACPYVLDCETAEVLHTDKGNPLHPPLNRYANIGALIEHLSSPS